MAGKVLVTAVAGPMAGQRFEFEEHDTFIFGRAPECHTQLPESDPSTSRHHFMLEVNPPQVTLRDLGSRNGTVVNGRKYGGPNAQADSPLTVALRHGDRIKVGRTELAIAIELPELDDDEEGSFVLFDNKDSDAGEKVVCAACFNDVTDEVRGQRLSESTYYICESCREASDPVAILRRISIEDAQRRGTEPKPALPGYTIGGVLGKGGMGAVYQGTRQGTGEEVALKVMLSRMAVDEEARKLFEREINVTRSLDHENIVRLLDHGALSGAFWFAMELCPCGSFHTLLEQHGKLSVEDAAPLMLGALDGLGYAHDNYFVHRDIKPGNILLGEGNQPKLGDFGLAKSFDTAGLSGITMVGNTAGTYSYMSKEQVTNFKFVKPVSDVWSMGAVFYQLLTGLLPRDDSASKNPLLAILDGKIIPIRERSPDVPAKIAKVIDRALTPSVTKRFQDGNAFRKALARVL